jgi:hypothetical protein
VTGAVPLGTAVPGPRGAARLAWGTTITGAFVVTLLRPVSWALGLLGFLAGGGVALVAWPIVVLPTPTGLQNALGGPVSSLVFGAPSTGLVLLIAGIVVGVFVVVAGGTLAGAWAERQGIVLALEGAADDGLELPVADLDGAPGAGRIAVVRLLALAPVIVAAALAWRPLYDAAYRELTLPLDLAAPLPVRVLRAAPLPVLGVIVTWLLSDAAAAVGVRRLVLERRPVLGAWLLGWVDLVRRPHRVLPTALVGVALLAALVAPAMVAAGIGWGRVREILAGGREPWLIAAAVAVWVAIWLGGLVLAGVGSAVRAAAFTLELPRTLPEPAGAAPDAEAAPWPPADTPAAGVVRLGPMDPAEGPPSPS